MSSTTGLPESETRASLDTLLPLGVLCLAFAAAYLLRSAKFAYLHESGAAILIGGIMGAIFQAFIPDAHLQSALFFDANFFMVVLLPAIIFESGYSLKKRIFFSNLGSILTFAVFGTVVTALVFAMLTYLVTLTGLTAELSLIECLIFGALISATDPVTTLALFKEQQVEHDLYANVFGESVLNDAVAITLFRVMTGFLEVDVTAGNITKATGEFALVFLGSLLIGAGIGIFSALLFKWTDMGRWPQMELAVMSVLAWASFLIAEIMHLSGIVSILFTGMAMAHYTQPNLSLPVQELVGNFFGVIAFVAETLVFTSLGLSIFFVKARYDWVLVIACCISSVVARAAEVFPLSAAINYFRPTKRIEFPSQVMLWYAGLRGAIAFSLALTVRSPHSDAMLSTTLLIVLISVVVLGAGTVPMLRFLKIRVHVPEPPSGSLAISQHLALLEWFDKRYFRNLFHRSTSPDLGHEMSVLGNNGSDAQPMLSGSSSGSDVEEAGNSSSSSSSGSSSRGQASNGMSLSL